MGLVLLLVLAEPLGQGHALDPNPLSSKDSGHGDPITVAAQWEARELLKPDARATVPLALVVNGVTSGLDDLKRDSPEWRRLWERTRMLVGYRSGTLNSSEMAELVGDCIIRPEHTPQCHFLSRDWVSEWGKNNPSFLPINGSPARDLPAGAVASDSGDGEATEAARVAAASRAPASVPALTRSQVVGALQDGELSV
ncbi:MAG TPA: hypothetical protein VL588_11645, partial [Bdellovibrionota bacterium]|nr:hypothetical protein [Bdellovibrionota bacterium]